jgi:hypothetical protein
MWPCFSSSELQWLAKGDVLIECSYFDDIGQSSGAHSNIIQVEASGDTCTSVGNFDFRYNHVEIAYDPHPDELYPGISWPGAMFQIVQTTVRPSSFWTLEKNWLNDGGRVNYVINCANGMEAITTFSNNLFGNGTGDDGQVEITGNCSWSGNLWACDESNFDDDVSSWNPPGCTSGATVWPTGP